MTPSKNILRSKQSQAINNFYSKWPCPFTNPWFELFPTTFCYKNLNFLFECGFNPIYETGYHYASFHYKDPRIHSRVLARVFKEYAEPDQLGGTNGLAFFSHQLLLSRVDTSEWVFTRLNINIFDYFSQKIYIYIYMKYILCSITWHIMWYLYFIFKNM